MSIDLKQKQTNAIFQNVFRKSPIHKIRRVAVYARVSTEFETQKTSIHNQLQIYDEYVKDKNWSIEKVYTDKKSGTKRNRPGFKALIEGAKNGEFDGILSKELSRITRAGALTLDIETLHRLVTRIDCIEKGAPRIFYRFSTPLIEKLLYDRK